MSYPRLHGSGSASKHCRKKSTNIDPLESQILVARLFYVYIKLSIKELPLNKFLHTQGLKADTNETDLVGLEGWLHRGDLTCGQPTIGSAKSAEPDNDT